MKKLKERLTAIFLAGTLLSSVMVTGPVAKVLADTGESEASSVSKGKLKSALNQALQKTQKQQNEAFQSKIKAQLAAQGIQVSDNSDLSQKTVTIIVELNREPASDKTAPPTGSAASISLIDQASAEVVAKQAPVKEKVEQLTDHKVRRSFGYLINGFSIEAKVSQIDQIKKIAGVKSVTPASLFYPEDLSADQIANVQKVWEKHQLKGEGTVISIIDSGIDPSHKDMTLDNTNTEKLTQTQASSAIQQLGYGKWYSDKVPFAYNYADGTADTVYDTGASEMHGMHVAGIAAANGKSDSQDSTSSVVGVAPDAQLLDMKVFSNNGGGAYSDDIVSAIEDSVKLGANVLNMSLGSVSGNQDQDDPEQEAVNEAADQGVISVISAGNSGQSTSTDATNKNNTVLTQDNGTIGTPGVAAKAITVASSENTTMVSSGLKITAGKDEIFSSPAVTQTSQKADLSVLNGKQLYFAQNGQNGMPGVGNPEDYDTEAVKGKIAVVLRGGLTFTQKQTNAIEAGAIGIIIINNKPEEGTIGFSWDESVPSFGILYKDGQTLVDYAQHHPDQTYDFEVKNLTSSNPNTGKMSSFSSYGPTPDLTLKPDITAPGGQIWSTANNNGYQEMSGTSMASPFVAGSSALIAENLGSSYSKSALSQTVKTDLMNTSTPLYDKDNPGAIISPRNQGAGLLQVDKAVENQVLATGETGDPSISLHQITSATQTLTVTLNNTSAQTATYQFNDYGGVWSGLNIKGYATDGQLKGADIKVNTAVNANHENVLTTDDKITVAPNSPVTVTFTLSLPTQATDSYIEGYLGFKSDGSNSEAQDLVVPYLGYYGNWNSQKIFDDPTWMADSFYGTSYFIDSNSPFQMPLGLNNKGDNVDPDNIAISPNYDDSKDVATPIFSLWRNAKDLKAQIFKKDPDQRENADQEPVRTLYLDPSVTKTYYDPSTNAYTTYSGSALQWDGTAWNTKAGEMDTVADGQYYYQVSASTADGSSQQTQTLPIKVDTTAPTVEIGQNALTKDEKGNYHLAVIIKDALSGLATPGVVAVSVNGTILTYSTPLPDDYTQNQAIDLTLDATQAAALKAGKNFIEVGVEDNAGNFGETTQTMQSPQETTYGLVLYNLNDGDVITTNSAIYHRRYNTITLTGSYPSDFYVNGKLIKVDPATQIFDMEDSKAGIPLPEDGKFVFSTDAQGKNVIRTVQTRLSVTEPTIKLDHTSDETINTDQTSFPVSGLVSPLNNLDVLVVANLSTGTIVDITKDVKDAGNNKGSFSQSLPLQFGQNLLVAQAADKDGNVNDVVKFTVNSSADAQFIADPSSVIVFDNSLDYGLNVISSATSFYDVESQTLTIKGHLRHQVDKDGLMIGETSGPRRTVVSYDPQTLAFETKLHVAPNTKVSVPVQVKYQGKTIVDNALQFYVDTTLPNLSLFNEKSLTQGKDGSYQIKTNQSPYHLQGSANDNYDGYQLTVNGNMVENQTFSFVFSKGPNGKEKTFDVPFDLSTGDNLAEIDLEDAVGNETSRKLNVRYYKATLAKPEVSLSTSNPTNQSVKIIAKPAAKASDAPTDENLQVEYSLDQGKTWQVYNDDVSLPTHLSILFKTIDDYGNESDTVSQEIDNFFPEIQAQATMGLQYQANPKKAIVTLGFDHALTSPDLANTHLQYSLDQGKTWQTYQQALQITQNTQVWARSIDDAGNTGKIITASLFDTPDQPKQPSKPASGDQTAKTGVAKITATYVSVYTTPNGTKTKLLLRKDTNWKVLDTQTVNGQTWYKVGKNQWISATGCAFKPTKASPVASEVKLSSKTFIRIVYHGKGGVRLLDRNGNYQKQYLKNGSRWQIFAKATIKGKLCYRLGTQKQWLPAQYAERH